MENERRIFNLRVPKSNSDNVNKCKTMLEIAKEINIDKQKVYRCIKKYNMPYKYIAENGTMYFDEMVQTRIKTILSEKKSVSKNSNEIREILNEVVQETVNEALKIQNKNIEIIIYKLDAIINLLQKTYELRS